MSDKDTASASAEHWERLAYEQDTQAILEDALGQPFGDTSAFRHRAETYRRTAQALRLEAATGKPHCSTCMGDHPNHLHAHRG